MAIRSSPFIVAAFCLVTATLRAEAVELVPRVVRGQPRELSRLPDGRLLLLTSTQELILDAETGRIEDVHPVAKAWERPSRRPGELLVQVSADGKLEARARGDEVEIIDASSKATIRHLTGERREGLGHTITDLDFAPDGRRLAATFSYGQIAVWDVSSGLRVGTMRTIFEEGWATDGVLGASGDRVYYLQRGVVREWRWEDDQQPLVVQVGDRPIASLAPSWDGGLLAAADDQGALTVIAVNDGEIVARPAWGGVPVELLRWLAPGREEPSLVTAGLDGLVTRWPLTPIRPPEVLTAHAAAVTHLSVARGSRYVASADSGDVVKVVDAADTSDVVEWWQPDGPITQLRQPVRGFVVSSSDGRPADQYGPVLPPTRQEPRWSQIAPDRLLGLQLAAAQLHCGNALMDAYANYGRHLAWRADRGVWDSWGRRPYDAGLEILDSEMPDALRESGRAPKWKVRVTPWPGQPDRLAIGGRLHLESDDSRTLTGARLTVVTSSDEGYIAAGTEDGRVAVWPIPGRRSRALTPVRVGEGASSKLSPDGMWVAVAAHGYLRLAATATGRVRWTRAVSPKVRRLAFAPDGNQIALLDEEKLEIITLSGVSPTPPLPIDVPDKPLPRNAPEVREGHRYSPLPPVRHLVWSPDGSRLALVGDDGWLSVIDAKAGVRLWSSPVAEDRGVGRVVQTLAWSPDGRWLATGGGTDWTVRTWGTADGKPGPVTQELWRPINGLAWSPDGGLLAGRDNGGNLIVWEIPSGQEVQRRLGVCDRPEGDTPKCRTVVREYPLSFSDEGDAVFERVGEEMARIVVPSGDETRTPFDEAASRAKELQTSRDGDTWASNADMQFEVHRKSEPRSRIFWAVDGGWLVADDQGAYDCEGPACDVIAWRINGRLVGPTHSKAPRRGLKPWR